MLPSSTVIFLNGPSSSGKSSIARALQRLLAEPYLHVGVDYFLAPLPSRYFGHDPAPGTPAAEGVQWLSRTDEHGQLFEIAVGPLARRVHAAGRAAAAGWARSGLNLILDEVLLDDEIFRGYLCEFAGLDVLFVGVHCSLLALEARERVRLDRAQGQARGHHELVHANKEYDVEVDSSDTSAEDCARAILARLHAGLPYGAFVRLRTALLPEAAPAGSAWLAPKPGRRCGR